MGIRTSKMRRLNYYVMVWGREESFKLIYFIILWIGCGAGMELKQRYSFECCGFKVFILLMLLFPSFFVVFILASPVLQKVSFSQSYETQLIIVDERLSGSVGKKKANFLRIRKDVSLFL